MHKKVTKTMVMPKETNGRVNSTILGAIIKSKLSHFNNNKVFKVILRPKILKIVCKKF